MARLAKLEMEGVPHHVAQRGNRGPTAFFADDDAADMTLMAEASRTANVAVWACYLTPDHVHLILVPSDTVGHRAALSGDPADPGPAWPPH